MVRDRTIRKKVMGGIGAQGRREGGNTGTWLVVVRLSRSVINQESKFALGDENPEDPLH